MVSFADHYQRPDLDDARKLVNALVNACAEADSADALLHLVEQWNRLRASIDTHYNIAMVRYEQDTRDEAAKSEQAFWDAAAPVMRELDVMHARALLDSKYKDALIERYGAQLLALKHCQQATFVPGIAGEVAEEAALSSEYIGILARPEVLFRGQNMSLSKLVGFLDNPDRQTRIDAQHAREDFLARNAEELERIYERMVTLRHGMATKLGNEDFIALAYQLRSRTSYGPGEVARFREAIVSHVVPLASRLHQQQARDLGQDHLLFHDEPVWSAAGNVRPTGDSASILRSAQRMYHELHPDMGAFFDTMLEHRLLDVELRDGKAGGGFCTNFADLGLPFIFANFNGSDSDIMVITHECGHAFQCYASRDIQPRVEYAFPTYEAAEIHSMGMEFLTYPWMELFFGERADAYRRVHLRRAICMLPYTACVDHFQHDVYENPGWSPSERNRRFRELEQLYLPHRDYGGQYAHFDKGTLWQRQSHIYSVPFYYIDYGLAQVCALQIWQKAQRDRAKALTDYLAICRVGGSLSFLDLLHLGDLRSPFDDACIGDLVGDLAGELAESLDSDLAIA